MNFMFPAMYPSPKEKSSCFASSDGEFMTVSVLIFSKFSLQTGQRCFFMQKIGWDHSRFTPWIFKVTPPFSSLGRLFM